MDKILSNDQGQQLQRWGYFYLSYITFDFLYELCKVQYVQTECHSKADNRLLIIQSLSEKLKIKLDPISQFRDVFHRLPTGLLANHPSWLSEKRAQYEKDGRRIHDR